MADGKTYIRELKEKIAALQDEVDGKDLSYLVLENNLTEVTDTSVNISKTTQIIIQMMMEVNLFVQKNGWTEKARANQARLVELLNLNQSIDAVSTQNFTLKLINKELFSQNQILRIENKEFKRQLENISKAENF